MNTLWFPAAVMAAGAAAALLLQKLPKAAAVSGVLSAAGGAVAGVIVMIRHYLGGGEFYFRDIFVLPILLLTFAAAVHAVGYLAGHGSERSGSYWAFFNVTAAAMLAVTQAVTGLEFLIAWEVMGAASFALVLFDRHNENSSRAAWIYMIACHAGAALLMLLFFFPHTPLWMFILAVIGFGLKIGFPLLHVWLPEAHPAAPAPVSALMSGAMIELGFLGIFSFGISGYGDFALYGWVFTVLGIIGALGGIIFALAQTNLKKMLAYSSIENMGILSSAVGLGMLGSHYQIPEMMIGGICGFVIHLFNHALFKGGLFLGAGSVYKAVGTLDMDKMGGLLKRMPRTGTYFILHALSLCGLPPFAGFAGEFLIYCAAFAGLTSGIAPLMWLSLSVLIVLALTGGLAAAAFAKVIGAVFCGEPRSKAAADAAEVPEYMNLVILLLLLISGLLLFSIPSLMILLAERLFASHVEVVGKLSGVAAQVGLISFAVSVLTLFFLLIRSIAARKRERISLTWDCGFAVPSAKMEYTATSFGATMVDFFGFLLRPRKKIVPPQGVFPEHAEYDEDIDDAGMRGCWKPFFKFWGFLADQIHKLQSGSLHFYLLVIVLTLLGMICFAVLGGK